MQQHHAQLRNTTTKTLSVLHGTLGRVVQNLRADGVFIESTAVHMDVYWNDEQSWHLHEDFDNLYGIGRQVYHSDFRVEGKNCYTENELIKVIGTEITPFNYNFIIDSSVTKSIVFNNRYFLDANTRRVMTHKMRDGKTSVFQIQDFVRVG